MQATFAREPLTDALWAEASPLLAAHYQEIAACKDIPLDPDREFYALAEASGLLRTYTARVGPRLVGYAQYVVRTAPHYRSSLQAYEDVLFVAREHRGRTGTQLILWSDEQLRAEGVQVVLRHVKATHDYRKLLERIGYRLVDLMLARRLDGPDDRCGRHGRGQPDHAEPDPAEGQGAEAAQPA